MRLKTILVLALMLAAANGFSQVSGNLLKVKGEAVVSQIPEDMVISIPVEVKDVAYTVCSNELISKYSLLVAQLVKNGISKEQIRSERLSVSENYEWEKMSRKTAGYVGNVVVLISMKYNPDILNVIMNTLKNPQFSFGYNVSFDLSNEQKLDLSNKAIQEAIQDATRKAQAISFGLKVRLADVSEVNYGYVISDEDSFSQVKYIAACAVANNDEMGAIDLKPGKVEVRQTIGVVWRIEQVQK